MKWSLLVRSIIFRFDSIQIILGSSVSVFQSYHIEATQTGGITPLKAHGFAGLEWDYAWHRWEPIWFLPIPPKVPTLTQQFQCIFFLFFEDILNLSNMVTCPKLGINIKELRVFELDISQSSVGKMHQGSISQGDLCIRWLVHVPWIFGSMDPSINERGRFRGNIVDGRNPANHLECKNPCKYWDKLPTWTG